MKFKVLRQRVHRAEMLLEHRKQRTWMHLQNVQTTWKAALTPCRVIGTGIAIGMLFGYIRSKKNAASSMQSTSNGHKLTQLLGLFTALARLYGNLPVFSQPQTPAPNPPAENQTTPSSPETHAEMYAD